MTHKKDLGLFVERDSQPKFQPDRFSRSRARNYWLKKKRKKKKREVELADVNRRGRR